MSNTFTTMKIDYKGKNYLVTESIVSPRVAVIYEINKNDEKTKIVDDYYLKSKILESCRCVTFQIFSIE